MEGLTIRFWIQIQHEQDNERAVFGILHDSLQIDLDINRTVIKRKSTTHRIDIPVEKVEEAFHHCFHMWRGGMLKAFWTSSGDIGGPTFIYGTVRDNE